MHALLYPGMFRFDRSVRSVGNDRSVGTDRSVDRSLSMELRSDRLVGAAVEVRLVRADVVCADELVVMVSAAAELTCAGPCTADPQAATVRMVTTPSASAAVRA